MSFPCADFMLAIFGLVGAEICLTLPALPRFLTLPPEPDVRGANLLGALEENFAMVYPLRLGERRLTLYAIATACF